MLVDVIRLTKGYVDFEAKGKFPERFLNLTARLGIAMWNAKPMKGGLSGSMSVSDYRKIRKAARKSRVKTKIVKKHGLPFITAKYRYRLGLPIGAAVGAVLLAVLSQFIWSYSIVGAEGISETRIMEALSEQGVKVGAFKGAVDVQQVERSALLELDELTWMSVNILGCTATVEVREKAKKPDIVKNPPPSNIKAKCDGVITKINARSGSTVAEVGSGVVKGDLLISGISTTAQNTVRYVRSDAEVYADVISDKELKIAKSYDYYSLTENKIDRNRLCFLWSQVPFSMSFGSFENTAYTQEDTRITLGGTVLPFGLKTETARELERHKITLDKDTAQKIFENSLLLYEVFQKGGSEVKSKTLTCREEGGEYIGDAEYIFNENIAENVEFSVTEGQ